jgi:hypothetical protein
VNKKIIFAMREQGGDFVVLFDTTGRIVDTQKYKEWLGPAIEPGKTVECCCGEGYVHLDCPIHALPPIDLSM